MGIAVDLGWSFFTQKAAQAAADDAALSAVQRGYKSIVSGGGVVTAFTACGTSNVTCEPTPVSCDPANTGLGNLQSGCLYAKNDGFVPGGHGGRQNVLIEANIPVWRSQTQYRRHRVRRRIWFIGSQSGHTKRYRSYFHSLTENRTAK